MAQPTTADAGEPPVIELRNVSKTFGEVRSLADVNFQVNRREIVGLLGDNGAGKSTLIKVVMGFYSPDPGGEIYFHGKRVDDWSVARARSLGHRDGLPGARAVREAADLAQHVHGPRAQERASACSTSSGCAS